MTRSQDISDAVRSELDFDPLVDPADITVKDLNGEVALNGIVPSYPQYLEAAAAAQRVEGVKRVHNHLMVKLPAGDYRDDAQLTTAANNALTWAVTVPPGVEAAARDGNLTLTGTVHFGTKRTAAETAVGGLIGIRNVKDEIAINFDADPGDVTVGVQDALTGHVRTWAEHDAALDAAWMASGVYDVIDNLVVTG